MFSPRPGLSVQCCRFCGAKRRTSSAASASRPPCSVVWFYITAPHKHVAYAAEVDPPTTRNALAPLPDGGAGNREFNAGRYPHGKYAYRIRSVRRVHLRTTYGVASVPRGVLYVPDTFLQNVKWEEQEEIWNDISECTTAENSRAVEKPLNMTTVDSESLASGFQEAQGLCLASEQTREGQDIVNNKRKASDEDGEQACSSRKKARFQFHFKDSILSAEHHSGVTN
ncbi:hypothetical protein DFH11DRAFT_1740551 [Phellopilus nigrolimitatus]|nr:hypothetical protein DFH11DRAFT_1740551 [Phellopilus nigrolimitatus]